jgi:hypothetical protein
LNSDLESKLRENTYALGLTPIEANLNTCSCKRHHQSKYWGTGAVDHEAHWSCSHNLPGLRKLGLALRLEHILPMTLNAAHVIKVLVERSFLFSVEEEDEAVPQCAIHLF